jgi:hypothetical protein
VIRPELVDKDPPAGRSAAATNLDPFHEPVLDEVALGTTDDGKAVLGESCEL